MLNLALFVYDEGGTVRKPAVWAQDTVLRGNFALEVAQHRVRSFQLLRPVLQCRSVIRADS